MLPEDHKVRFSEIHGFFDPDALTHCTKPPPEMMAHAIDVFGEKISWDKLDGGEVPDRGRIGWLKLRLHPWMQRWCLFQWCPDYRDGTMCWRPTYIAAKEAKDGVLPVDLDYTDGRFDDLRGKLGEYHAPNKQDFADYARVADREKYDSLYEHSRALMEDRHKAQQEMNRQFDDYERDQVEYYALLGHRDLNRALGAHQSGLAMMPMTSLDELEKKVRAERYEAEERETPSGEKYTIYHRRKSLDPETDRLLKAWEERQDETRKIRELWPDVNPDELDTALKEKQARALRLERWKQEQAEIAAEAAAAKLDEAVNREAGSTNTQQVDILKRRQMLAQVQGKKL